MTASPAQQYLQEFSRLADSRTWTERDSIVEAMEQLYNNISHDSREAIVLCFSLAKIYDDLKEYDKSFELLAEGNSRHRKGKTDTVADARATITSVRNIFNAQAPVPLASTSSLRPLFIVGMPRSGTSLVEQILATHSRVTGGGELKLMGQWCVGYLKLVAEHGNAANLEQYLPQLRSHYEKGVRHLGLDDSFTDKMPMNFLWLGFILSVFPEARIIHTSRDPMAVCWSNYKTAFAGTSNGYSCDLGDIGEFYSLYASLMKFWQRLFPKRIYNLDYERLTSDPEEEIRKLLDYCGFEWQANCLEFHKNPRQVRTMSWAQVKRPMYQGSSEAWKHYEKFLEPLKQALVRGGVVV